MFSTAVRGRKTFADEENVRELQKRISPLKCLEKKDKISCRTKPHNIIKKSSDNINSLQSKTTKYHQTNLKKKFLASAQFKEWFDITRLKKVSNKVMRQEKIDKIYDRKKRKLWQILEVGEVLVLSERIKKKDSPGKFYKSSTENRPHFNKNIILSIDIIFTIFYFLETKFGWKNVSSYWSKKTYTRQN